MGFIRRVIKNEENALPLASAGPVLGLAVVEETVFRRLGASVETDGVMSDCADAPWRERLGKWNMCSERERWLRGEMSAASWGGTVVLAEC
ncbi:hypothetical protein D623_10010156 [Myotis brandtii]|uniref:Uncharacterized protein n=1 Tax=Myotis brandtii TaxID=109478 RepID=S7Q2S8_MYOBR|nr:hypothetical protein D623_10010156 [Myotis brandtii]